MNTRNPIKNGYVFVDDVAQEEIFFGKEIEGFTGSSFISISFFTPWKIHT